MIDSTTTGGSSLRLSPIRRPVLRPKPVSLCLSLSRFLLVNRFRQASRFHRVNRPPQPVNLFPLLARCPPVSHYRQASRHCRQANQYSNRLSRHCRRRNLNDHSNKLQSRHLLHPLLLPLKGSNLRERKTRQKSRPRPLHQQAVLQNRPLENYPARPKLEISTRSRQSTPNLPNRRKTKSRRWIKSLGGLRPGLLA